MSITICLLNSSRPPSLQRRAQVGSRRAATARIVREVAEEIVAVSLAATVVEEAVVVIEETTEVVGVEMARRTISTTVIETMLKEPTRIHEV